MSTSRVRSPRQHFVRAAWLLLSIASFAPASGFAEPAQAPDYVLHLFAGANVPSTSLKGKVVVLNFWASWCIPCRRELAELDAEFVRRGPGRLAIFAIDAEQTPDPYRLQRQAGLLHIPVATAIVGDYRPRHNAVPTTFVIDQNGRIVLSRAGALKPGEIGRLLDGLLGVTAANGNSH